MHLGLNITEGCPHIRGGLYIQKMYQNSGSRKVPFIANVYFYAQSSKSLTDLIPGTLRMVPTTGAMQRVLSHSY